MRWFCSFVLVAVTSSSAWAEGTPEQEARMASIDAGFVALRDCVASSASADCIGAYSTECIAEFAQNHSDEGNCVYEERQLWTAAHNEILMRKFDEARTIDIREILDGMPTGGGRLALVMQSEVSWIAHARNQCDLEMRRWGAGTINVTQRPHCDIRMIAARVDFLKNLQL